MAKEKYFPFRSVSGDRKYSAEDWAAYFALFIGNGVFYSSADKLKVAEYDGMKIKVQKGAGFIAGRMYLLEEDTTITLDTADGVLSRIDRIVLRCDYDNRLMIVTVKKGSYSAEPTAPDLTRDAGVYELALADIYVAAGAVTITAANITDQRFNTSLCGIVTGLIEQADTEEIFSQFQAAFEEWFEYVKAVLDEDATGNLLKQIEVERARIDALTKMEEGSTTGDAELQDVRIGADGVTYETAGAAVRAQIADVKSDLSNMCLCKNLLGMTPHKLYAIELTLGEYLTMSTSDGSAMTKQVPLWFYDKDGNYLDYYNFLSGTTSRTVVVDEIIANAKYITWTESYDIPLQVEKGGTVTSYVEYFANPKQNELEHKILKNDFSATANLIGMSTNILYPVNLKSGELISFSNANNEPLERTVSVYCYDEKGNYIDYYNFHAGMTTRNGIQLTEDIYYMRWTSSDIKLQINKGDKALPYEEYISTIRATPTLLDVNAVTQLGSSNMVGMTPNRAYYVGKLEVGTTLIFGTSDGSAMTKTIQLNLYNENREYVDYYNFVEGTSKRTVPIDVECHYLSWSDAYEVPLYVTTNSENQSFDEYKPPFENVLKDIDYLMSDKLSVSDIHSKEKHDMYSLKRSFTISGSTENTLKILWCSDIHAEHERTKRMVELLNAWGGEYFDIAINTGDTTFTLFEHGLEEYQKIVEKSKVNILNTVGNHDAWLQLGGENAPMTDVYNMVIKPLEAYDIVQPVNAELNGYNYYYKDVNGIRIIILDCMYWTDTQLEWFKSVLTNANTNNIPVIACCHAPFNSDICQMVESNWNNVYDRDGTLLSNECAIAVSEFIDNGGVFITWLLGHTHNDEIYTLPSYNNQLAIHTDSFTDRGTRKVKNTDGHAYNFDLLNYVTVDTQNKLLKVYRIGADVDYLGKKNKCFVWNYETRTKVTEW